MEELLIGEEYKLISLITKGHHAEVYYGISIKNGKEYAIKIQTSMSSCLMRQASLLQSIQSENNIIADYGLPTCFYFQRGDKRNALVVSLFGKNLNKLLDKCQGIFKIKTFLMIAEQMLKRLQLLHSRGFIHRSITLKKWVLGTGQNRKKLYLIGFGRSKQYTRKGIHISYSENKPVLNSKEFASINNHLGIQPSRRDDLESMLYCWAKMLYGRLPWEEETDNDRLLSRKIEQRSQVLFAKFPQPLIDLGKYIRQLSFEQSPDYGKLRNWIKELFDHYELDYDYAYDWEQVLNLGQSGSS